MKRDDSSPDAYRADVEEPQRSLLEAVRSAILEVDPECCEGIRYGMLDYPGLANLAAQKSHVALYLVPEVLARHKHRFGSAGARSGKSCLRFRRLEEADPEALRALLEAVRASRAK